MNQYNTKTRLRWWKRIAHLKAKARAPEALSAFGWANEISRGICKDKDNNTDDNDNNNNDNNSNNNNNI